MALTTPSASAELAVSALWVIGEVVIHALEVPFRGSRCNVDGEAIVVPRRVAALRVRQGQLNAGRCTTAWPWSLPITILSAGAMNQGPGILALRRAYGVQADRPG